MYVQPQQRRVVWQWWRSGYLYLFCVFFCLAILFLLLWNAADLVLAVTGTYGAIAPSPVVAASGAATTTSIVPFGQQQTAGNAIAVGQATTADSIKIAGTASALFQGTSSLQSGGGGVSLSIDNGDVEVHNGYLHVQGQIGTDTGVVQPSDARYKRDIERLSPQDALNSIIQLKPSKYRFVEWWPGEVREEVGFVAQEMEQVAPHAVKRVSRHVPNQYGQVDHVEDFRMVDKSALTPQLVGAIQELTDRVIGQQRQIEQLQRALQAVQQQQPSSE